MIALVTAAAASGLDPDLEPLAHELGGRVGVDQVEVVDWHADLDWSRFEAVVIRSTWDYTDRLDEFLAWVDRVDRVSRLVNAAPLVRWSADKRYLADLADEDIAITPTVFVPPGAPVPSDRVFELFDRAGHEVAVVKPTVGAGSSGAQRCVGHQIADHVSALHAQGRTAMVQPYLPALDELGETAVCMVAGDDGAPTLSHAFGKAAILRSNDVEQVGDLFAKEDISPREVTPAELDLATKALGSRAVRSRGRPTFARVDVAPFDGRRDDPDALVVMELELIEPSFYFHVDPQAPSRFASALLDDLRRVPEPPVR